MLLKHTKFVRSKVERTNVVGSEVINTNIVRPNDIQLNANISNVVTFKVDGTKVSEKRLLEQMLHGKQTLEHNNTTLKKRFCSI